VQEGGLRVKLHAQLLRIQVLFDKYIGADRLNTLARILILTYFFNHAYTGVEIWWYYRQPFPWINFWLMPASLLIGLDFNIQVTTFCASAVALYAMYDSCTIFGQQLVYWYQMGSLYINELMVKKLSLFGAVGLLLAHKWQTERKKNAMAGLLLSSVEEMTDSKSVAMLAGRLLMSTLFLFVGWSEVVRQWNSVWSDAEGHVHHLRKRGDGHDNMWSKLAEFALCLPFVVGFKTKLTARLLAAVVFLEAFVSWSWFLSKLNIGYRIHAREHFTVNLGVCGGLILLASIGAGKYTIDNYLKKDN